MAGNGWWSSSDSWYVPFVLVVRFDGFIVVDSLVFYADLCFLFVFLIKVS